MSFELAPPAKSVDGLLAVPVDIASIAAVFTFNGSSQTAAADATITYTVGATGGNPIFDLRQTITQAWLDGTIFPVAQLAHHTFGSGSFTDLRVIESVQAAGSVHTLRVQYALELPQSQLGGSYLPAIEWTAGPKLRFVFGLSDLNRARYAEAWLPANLIFDQYSIDLEIEISNTMAAHTPITNGAVTVVGANHWNIAFPARFTALSPMLEIRASDTVTHQTDLVLLPVSGKTVLLEAWKPTPSAVDLGAQLNVMKNLLTRNENSYGPYLHEERFVALFSATGGMEYEGGTTTSTGALLHETFHSWFARGIKPGSQADGWWDEAFTVFNDDGANDTLPFDFTDAPIVLCSRDPWQRHTPGNAYSDGSTFWRGMASLLGVAQLKSLMAALYAKYKGQPVSTGMIEEFLLSHSGNASVVDAFHRFVYGLADPSPSPDLWIRDDPAHTGADAWGGDFWDSPDLWIRHADDGGTTHQPPEYGQDNWFHARVRNKSATGTATHFVVTFHSKGYAGTEFVYPGDFLPCIAAKAEFDLAPGATRIIKARWPRANVPPEGTHTCMLASVLSRTDRPLAGRHVWEHNNLAQKNLTVVDLLPDTFMILPIVLSNWLALVEPGFEIEVRLPREGEVAASVLHKSKTFLRHAKGLQPFAPVFSAAPTHAASAVVLECGGHAPGSASAERGRIMTSDTPDLVLARFGGAWEAVLPKSRNPVLAVDIAPRSQTLVGVKLAVPAHARSGTSVKLHVVQRHAATKQVVGGVAVQVNVVKEKRPHIAQVPLVLAAELQHA